MELNHADLRTIMGHLASIADSLETMAEAQMAQAAALERLLEQQQQREGVMA